jgi:hypothetical protein
MGDRRPSNSELRLRRLEQQERPRDEERGILELFDEVAEPEPERDEDAPLAREDDSE